jgi:hypothetical protein
VEVMAVKTPLKAKILNKRIGSKLDSIQHATFNAVSPLSPGWLG